jgi:hypothetical protein
VFFALPGSAIRELPRWRCQAGIAIAIAIFIVRCAYDMEGHRMQLDLSLLACETSVLE